MKASELINILKKKIEQNGDWDVVVEQNENGWHSIECVQTFDDSEVGESQFSIMIEH